MSTEPRTRAWIEVRGDALRGNLRRVRERVGPGPALIPMVKSNGYGLGLSQTVRALSGEDPWGWGVATVEEGAEVRAVDPDRPVLVVSPAAPGAAAEGVSRRLTFGVSDLGFLERVRREAERRGTTASVHLEIDTGMGRAGFDWRRVEDWGPRAAALTGGRVRWDGCFTHFHSADESGDAGIEVQAERFHDTLRALEKGAEVDTGPMLLHLCNSAGALRRPDLAAGAVRPGIFLYGGSAGADLPPPEPTAAVRARIALVREAPPGTTVGYGATYRATGWERWATVGIGYGDGLRRALSNRGHGLVRGRRVPIVGRISMDMAVVDITGLEGVDVGTPVTFLGEDGGARITLEEVAEHVGTIGYEILTGLTSRLPRIWLEDGTSPGAS